MSSNSILAPFLWGAAGGAIAATALGFFTGFWMTTSKAEAVAVDRASNAVVVALAPICLDNYRNSPDASAQLSALKKLDEWKYASFIEQRGWAKMPGSESVNSSVASACAKLILGAKS